MRPRETPHTSTPIAGAQTSQAHKLSQDLEPPASRSLSSWPAAQRRGLPSCPPRGWCREPACSGGHRPPRRGCWHPRAMERLQRSHGAEAVATSASPLQADTALGDGIAAASALPCRPACEPTHQQGPLRGYKHWAWTPKSPLHSRTTKPLSFTAACQ